MPDLDARGCVNYRNLMCRPEITGGTFCLATRILPLSSVFRSIWNMKGSASDATINESLSKLQVLIDIGKIRGQANRSAQCAGRLALDDVQELLKRHPILIRETDFQIVSGKTKRNFARTRITVASRAQRNAFLIRQSLQGITVERCASRIEENHLNGFHPADRDWAARRGELAAGRALY